MRKDQHIEIEGIPVMLSSERGSITHGNAPRATPVVNWSVFYGGETIARAYAKDIVLKRARAALEKLGKLPKVANAPRASHVASRYLSAAEARVKLPKLEGYHFALDAVFSDEDDDTAMDWFAAACSPEGAPLDPVLMARVVRLLQEERQAMEAEVAKEMQKPLRSVVDSYHERDVSLIKTNKAFIKNFDVWLRKLMARTASVEVTPTFVEIWTKALGEEAAGLDFKDPEDRATFRINVENRMGNLAATMVRALAARMGAPVGGASGRTVATRAIADAWMKGARP